MITLKATGIVRRIDELGRVVIPKEIRRTLRIREGDPLEIFTDRDGEIILKKYSPIGELSGYATEFVLSINKTFGISAAISDKDVFIAASGSGKRDLAEKPVSGDIEQAILMRTQLTRSALKGDMIRITDGDDREPYTAVYLSPIIALGDPIGAVLALSREEHAVISPDVTKACEMVASFLGKLMEQ